MIINFVWPTLNFSSFVHDNGIVWTPSLFTEISISIITKYVWKCKYTYYKSFQFIYIYVEFIYTRDEGKGLSVNLNISLSIPSLFL